MFVVIGCKEQRLRNLINLHGIGDAVMAVHGKKTEVLHLEATVLTTYPDVKSKPGLKEEAVYISNLQ